MGHYFIHCFCNAQMSTHDGFVGQLQNVRPSNLFPGHLTQDPSMGWNIRYKMLPLISNHIIADALYTAFSLFLALCHNMANVSSWICSSAIVPAYIWLNGSRSVKWLPFFLTSFGFQEPLLSLHYTSVYQFPTPCLDYLVPLPHLYCLQSIYKLGFASP